MNRRKFLASAIAASLAAPTLPTFALTEWSSVWRQFQITTRVTLPDIPGPAELWLPLAQTAGDYQAARISGFPPTISWSGGPASEIVCDARYGAPILHKVWKENNPFPRQFEVNQTVAVRDRDRGASHLLPLTEAERKFWSAPTESIPLDGVVLAMAAKITTSKNAPRERLRAIYDWVVDHTHRDPDVSGCGRGDIKAMLEKGQFGGKCADINGLMVGLARAAGFPAREVYGIRVAPSKSSQVFPSLGVSGDISKAQHCRAEVFLDGEGWFPVDPADVRKVVLAEKLALDSPQVRELREQLFGTWEMNWIGFNSATDIVLPGIGERKPDFAFLMYPCAFTSEGNCPCTDPAKFRYQITSQEVPAY